MGTYHISFIGGVLDGQEQSGYNLPPEILVPMMDTLNIMDYYSEDYDPSKLIPIKICVYKRILDTMNYVCLEVYRK